MSVCAQPEEESSVDEGFSREWQEDKAASKIVRVLTVLAYLLSVSLAAILLSVYYVCVWRSPELPLQHSADANARQAHPAEYDPAYHEQPHVYNFSGGSNITVSEAAQTANITSSPFEVSSSSEPSPTPLETSSDQPLTTDVIGSSSNEPNYTNIT